MFASVISIKILKSVIEIKIYKSIFKNYPHDALHMYEESAPTVLRSESVLNNLPGEVYSIEADDISLDDFRYPFSVIQAAQDQRETNTECLVMLLQLKIGAKVMLTVIIDIQDRLIDNHCSKYHYKGILSSSIHRLV